jgi:hypothetical protein
VKVAIAIPYTVKIVRTTRKSMAIHGDIGLKFPYHGSLNLKRGVSYE